MRYGYYIYGYSDTSQKHNLTLMLRCNGIEYEFIDSDIDYGEAVCIHIPKPQYKWQRKVVDNLCEAINRCDDDGNTWFPICTNTPIKIYRRNANDFSQ